MKTYNQGREGQSPSISYIHCLIQTKCYLGLLIQKELPTALGLPSFKTTDFSVASEMATEMDMLHQEVTMLQ